VVVHFRIATGEVQTFVAVVRPPDPVRRRTVVPTHCEDLGVAARMSDEARLDDQAVADGSFHGPTS
jgi:hypothetical protein